MTPAGIERVRANANAMWADPARAAHVRAAIREARMVVFTPDMKACVRAMWERATIREIAKRVGVCTRTLVQFISNGGLAGD